MKQQKVQRRICITQRLQEPFFYEGRKVEFFSSALPIVFWILSVMHVDYGLSLLNEEAVFAVHIPQLLKTSHPRRSTTFYNPSWKKACFVLETKDSENDFGIS
jgi:hypothetical protein